MNKFTFHVVNLPHTQTTSEYTHCAYTQKVRKFCNMMTDLGHDVYLYGSEDNEARVKENIIVISKKKQQEFFGDNDHTKKFFNITWGPQDPHWVYMNNNAIKEINKRINKKDFIGIIGGTCQKMIADAFPNNFSVEYGIGYSGVFSRFKVFESYAHMHFVSGWYQNDNGDFYSTVIPNYYDVDEFPFSEETDDYYLFIGRLIDRKGYSIAQQVCEKLGKRLIVAGQGDFSGYGEYVGVVGVEERGRLMSKAKAVFVPTTYLEPFGGVHAEALLCGTPVITTNFGVFTETVVNGENGYRCDTFRDFLRAVEKIDKFNINKKLKIQKNAQKRFSTNEVAKTYDAYFSRLMDLYEDGWYQL